MKITTAWEMGKGGPELMGMWGGDAEGTHHMVQVLMRRGAPVRELVLNVPDSAIESLFATPEVEAVPEPGGIKSWAQVLDRHKVDRGPKEEPVVTDQPRCEIAFGTCSDKDCGYAGRCLAAKAQPETITVPVEVLERAHHAATKDAFEDAVKGKVWPPTGLADWPTFLARLREQATTGRCEHTFSHATPGRVSLRCSLNAGHDGQHR